MKYKNVELDDKLAGVIRHMHTVDEYREVLQSLQAVWDNLTLLGQLSGTGNDMSGTRQAFHQLTADLLNQLGAETLRKCVLEVSSKAQVAIDILIRNLYERTADIGFLATDEDVREYLRAAALAEHHHDDGHAADPLETAARRLRARFAEYVAKYSVYSDIVLLDPAGQVLLRLNDTPGVERSRESLVRESLQTSGAYVETFGPLDLLPDAPRSLVYSYRVTDGKGRALGVLCLCFRFENEMAGIFANLGSADDWSVLTLLDAQGTVIASSDAFHIPIGARLPPVTDVPYRIVRFGGQEYIAVTRASSGYQGYLGPGWTGQVMLPVQHAFRLDSSDMLHGLPRAVLDAVMRSTSLFGAALRSVPVQAERIQRDLNRSVWNGSVRQGSGGQAMNPAFSKILLWEISNTGGRTKEVFERSIHNLHETVVSAILEDSSFQAALAIDIMDRNLYERANDCRWWALTSAFRGLLSRPALSPDAAAQISDILSYINGLYTVYANLLVFDGTGKILAVSNPEERSCVGEQIGEDWHRQVLALRDSQAYAVSTFAATPLYGGRHTYIYGAAIRAPDQSRVVGGVGIVFDSEPQFAAMLRDALPRGEGGQIQAGAFGVFAGRDGRIIACSDERLRPGDALAIERDYLDLPQGASRAGVVLLDGQYYAAGARTSSGYREYKGSSDPYRNEVLAVILVPLCADSAEALRPESLRPNIPSDRGRDDTLEIATFLVGRSWYGLRAHEIAEAVDAAGVTPVPGSGAAFTGYLLYQGTPIPVFDVRPLLEETAGAIPELRARQVIVLRRSPSIHFGVLVDALGDIPEIAKDRLAELPRMLGGKCVVADAVIAIDQDAPNHMLLVLAMERLYSRLLPSARAVSPSLEESPAQLPVA